LDELINEPWVGDIYSFPDLLEAGTADKKNLLPLYTALQSTIRANDDRHIIFYEGSLSFGDVLWASGFNSSVLGGPAYRNRQVFSIHLYCGFDKYNGDPESRLECDISDSEQMTVKLNDLANIQNLGMVTEFGDVTNDSASVAELQWITGEVDGAFSAIGGWIYWQFKSFNDITTQARGNLTLNTTTQEGFYYNGSLETAKVRALSRTYPQAIAGSPTSFSFNPVTYDFELQYNISNATAPTEIFLNEAFFYSKGFTVTITPNNAATFAHPSTNLITIIVNQGVADGTPIIVQIQAN